MSPTAFAWLLLCVSVVAEVFGSAGLKLSAGLSHPVASAFAVVCFACQIWLMGQATKHLEMGLAYACWAAASTALTAVVGAIWFGEAVPPFKLISIALSICGLVLLNLGGSRA